MPFVNVIAGVVAAVLMGFVFYVEGRGLVRAAIEVIAWIRRVLQRHRARKLGEVEGS